MRRQSSRQRDDGARSLRKPRACAHPIAFGALATAAIGRVALSERAFCAASLVPPAAIGVAGWIGARVGGASMQDNRAMARLAGVAVGAAAAVAVVGLVQGLVACESLTFGCTAGAVFNGFSAASTAVLGALAGSCAWSGYNNALSDSVGTLAAALVGAHALRGTTL